MKQTTFESGCWPIDPGGTLMIRYHDTEWGRPVHDDQKHFEYSVFDAFQAGLSWRTILNKRENFRKAFSHFNPKLSAAGLVNDHLVGCAQYRNGK